MEHRKIRLANKETGPESIRVVDENLLDMLKNVVLEYWPSRRSDFFPGPQPVSLERRDLSKLTEFDYLVCVKSDGMRFLMVIWSGKTYMVDRAFKFYEVVQNFDEKSLYPDGVKNMCGGIFDGELIRNRQGRWQFVVHDCICMANTDVSQCMFPERYSQVTRLVEEFWVAKGSEFRISEKQFFTFRQLRMLERLIEEEKLDHKTDGLIFTPKNRKVGTQTQYDLFKWKPRNLHTFDFKIIKTPNGIIAYVNKNGQHIPYASVESKSKEEKIFLDGLKENCPEFNNGNIVECEYDEVADTYRPVKIRLDKTHPNSLFTVRKTLGNIKESITVGELIDLGD
jgi:mRNA guanylyltransferase